MVANARPIIFRLCIDSISLLLLLLLSAILCIIRKILIGNVIVINILQPILSIRFTLAELLAVLGYVGNDLAAGEAPAVECGGTFGGALRVSEADGDDAAFLEVVEDCVGDLAVVCRFVADVFFDFEQSCGIFL